MIVKERKIPLFIQKLEALLRRIPHDHPKYPFIKEQYAKSMSGYKGEKAIDFPLSFLPKENHFILHDIRLRHQDHFFQMDTLLLTKRYCLLIEVKNIAGTLYFDPDFNQLIRTKNGEETAFPDPLLQIYRQKTQLSQWITGKRLPAIPIIPLVVASNPQAVIRTSPHNTKNVSRIVVRSDFLPSKIDQMEEMYTEQVLSEKELKKTIRLLKKHNLPADFSILERFQLKREEILTGVICAKCDHSPMKRVYDNWLCMTCGHKDKTAHLVALKDYSLLIGHEVNNTQIREFLRLTSPSLVTRLLHPLNLSSSGTGKGKVHFLPTEE